MSVFKNVQRIELDINYLFYLYDYYIGFSDKQIIFINKSLDKIATKCNIDILGKPYLCPYNEKMIIQYFNLSNSKYDIFKLNGVKLTITPQDHNNNYLILYNNILINISIFDNKIRLLDSNNIVKILIDLEFKIIWTSNPISYIVNEISHIIILVKSNKYCYFIIDITDNITSISRDININYDIDYERITIGYNNTLEVYMPHNKYILYAIISPEYLNSYTINNKVYSKIENQLLIKTFKSSNNFSIILDDLKGEKKNNFFYTIDINSWQQLYLDSSHNFSLKNRGISDLLKNEPISELQYCKSDNYNDYITFIINNWDNLMNLNNYIYFYSSLDDAEYFNFAYSDNNLIERLRQTINLVDNSNTDELKDSNYFLSTYTLTITDNNLKKRYYPISEYLKPLLDKSIYYITIPNNLTKPKLLNKIIDLLIKLNIISFKLNFSIIPFTKVSSEHIKLLGKEYFINIQKYINIDIDLKLNVYLIWNTLINPIFNSKDDIFSCNDTNVISNKLININQLYISNLISILDQYTLITLDELYKEIYNKKIIMDLHIKNYGIFLQDFYKECIYLNTSFEIFIIHWKKGYKSIIHDHAKNGCILYNIYGLLEETIYDSIQNKSLIKKHNIESHNISIMKNEYGVHSICALENSISLHIYSPPFGSKK